MMLHVRRRRTSAGLMVGGLGVLLLLAACAAAAPTPEGVVVTVEVAGEGGETLLVTATPALLIAQSSASDAEAQNPGSGDEIAAVSAGQPQRMIIKNGEMSLVVEDVGIAIDRVTQIAIDNGGYVLSSQSWNNGDSAGATITFAVQAENFETAMRRLRDIALEVRTESATGQDVSTEYVDLESRLRNLEATRDRIRTFLDQADNVEEALAVNKELSDIEAEIEQVKGRMNFLTGRAAFSTITVDLQNLVEATPTPTPTPAPPWSLNPTVRSAVETQTSLVRGLTQAFTWMTIVLGPYVLIVAAIVGVGWAISRRRSKP